MGTVSREDLRAQLQAALADLAEGRGDPAALTAAAGALLADHESLEATVEAQFEQIQAQRAALAEIGCPVLQVRKDILCAPLVGEFDADRMTGLADVLLNASVTRRVRTVIVDVTGAVFADASAASDLATVFRALRLVGVQAVISGISPATATLLAATEETLTDVRCHADLAGALAADGDSFAHGRR